MPRHGRGRKAKLEDYPRLLARYDAGETIQDLAASYRATHHTLRKLLVESGRAIRKGLSPLEYVEAALANRYHWRRVKFRLPPEVARLLHEMADESGREPEDLLAEAVQILADRRNHP